MVFLLFMCGTVAFKRGAQVFTSSRFLFIFFLLFLPPTPATPMIESRLAYSLELQALIELPIERKIE